MQRTLSFERTPPLPAVLRYFLGAPLFAVLAGLLLLWTGPAALFSRWSLPTLALTHLLTLGFLGSAMVGALIQILPVVAQYTLPRAELTARGVHGLLCAGTLTLVTAFLLGVPWLFAPALALLLAAFLWLLGATTVGMWQPHPPGAAEMVATVRLALGALVVTVVLGALMVTSFGWPGWLALPLMALTDLHALWGLLGWTGLLVVGVAFQMVPMFQVTALYPDQATRWLGLPLFVLLVLWSITHMVLQGRGHWFQALLEVAILAGLAGFAGLTLHLMARRKRPEPDAMTLFWRLAMASLLACAVLWLVPPRLLGSARPLLLGLLFILGFAYSTINGMLYKIVPFLVWYHLQESGAGRAAPGVKLIIPDDVARRQFWAHCAAVLLAAGAALWPQQLARPCALALCLSAGWLMVNLLLAVRVYRKFIPRAGK